MCFLGDARNFLWAIWQSVHRVKCDSGRTRKVRKGPGTLSENRSTGLSEVVEPTKSRFTTTKYSGEIQRCGAEKIIEHAFFDDLAPYTTSA